MGTIFLEYPYPLVNYHDRPPVCFEVANTILSILCDFRNYKYKVVTVPGLSVITTKEGVIVNIPYNRFEFFKCLMFNINCVAHRS